MTTPKQLFLTKKELASRLRDVVTSPWFQECLTYVRAEMMGKTGSIDELKGAARFEDALLDLPIEIPETPPDASGALEHDLDSPNRNREQSEPKK